VSYRARHTGRYPVVLKCFDELNSLIRSNCDVAIVTDGSGNSFNLPVGFGGFVLERKANLPFQVVAPIAGGLKYGGTINVAELLAPILGVKTYHCLAGKHRCEQERRKLRIDIISDSQYAVSCIQKTVYSQNFEDILGEKNGDLCCMLRFFSCQFYDIYATHVDRDTILFNHWSDRLAAMARDYNKAITIPQEAKEYIS